MATLTEMTLDMTVNGSSVQLPTNSATGWSSTSSTLTLSPTTSTMPVIYAATINPPSGYQFTGGTSLSFGSNTDATYVTMMPLTALPQGVPPSVYLIAANSLSSGSASNNLTLNLSNGTNTPSLTITVQFQIQS